MPAQEDTPPPPPLSEGGGVLSNAAGVVAPQNLIHPSHAVSLANWRDAVAPPNAAALAQARLSARAAQQHEDDLFLNLLLERRRAAELQQAAGLSAAATGGLPHGYYGLGTSGFPPSAALGLAPGAAAPGALGLGTSAHLLGVGHPSAAVLRGRDFLTERDAALLEAARAQQAAALGGLPPAYMQQHSSAALARQWEAERARQLELQAHELELRAKMQEERAAQAAAYAKASSAHAAGHSPRLVGAASTTASTGSEEDRKPQANDGLKAAANSGVAKEDSDAFQLFFTEEREKVLKEIEEHSGKKNGPSKIKFQELSAIVASRWENLPTRQRQYYQNLAGTTKTSKSQDRKAVAKNKQKSKPKLKGAPKRPGSAFLLFSNSRRKDAKRDNPSATNAELSKILSTLWKEAPEEVRQHYIEEAQVRASSYKEEMANFIRKMHGAQPKDVIQSDGHGGEEGKPELNAGKRKAPESESDEEEGAALASHGKNVPKRPMSAFLAFSNKRRRALKLQHPTASNSDLSKMLSKTWKEAPDIVKQKYLEEAQEKSEEYKEAIAQWRKSHPGERINRSSLQIMASQKSRPRKKKKKAAVEPDQMDALAKEDSKADLESKSDDSMVSEDMSEQKSMDVESQNKKHHTNVSVEGQIVKLYHENKWDALTLASRVSDLCRVFRWEEVKTATVSCFRKSRDQHREGMEHVINRSKALNIFRTKITGADVGVLCDELVEDFVDSFEKLVDTDGGKISNAFIAVKYLMQLGTAEQLERVQDRANSFPLEILETVQKLVDEARGVDARDENAVEHFIDIIDTRYKNLKIESLMEQRDELVESTKNGGSLTPDDAGVKDYRKKMVALRKVCLQLQKLGKNVELLGSPADPDEAEAENGTTGAVKESVATEAKAPKDNSENEYLTADEEDDEKEDTVDQPDTKSKPPEAAPEKADSEKDDEKSEREADQEKERHQDAPNDKSDETDQAVVKDTMDEPEKETKGSEDNNAQAKDTSVSDDAKEAEKASPPEEKGAKSEEGADDEETDTEDEGSLSESMKTKE